VRVEGLLHGGQLSTGTGNVKVPSRQVRLTLDQRFAAGQFVAAHRACQQGRPFGVVADWRSF
jgi:hypothetical protein